MYFKENLKTAYLNTNFATQERLEKLQENLNPQKVEND